MSIYDDMRAVASDVMRDFKQGVIQYVPIITTPGTTPDRPGATSKGAPVTINATARTVSTKYVDGTTIQQSDTQVTMPDDGTEPTMNGFVRIDGVDHRIIQIMPKPAAGTPVAWTVIVRR